MARRGFLWLVGCLVLAHAIATAATPAAAPLRVVSDNNFPPYLFLGPDGKPQGYLVDLWALWSRKTGVKVDLEPMQWAAAQRALLDGKADVIDMIYRTPEREPLYDFSPPYTTQTIGVYVDRGIQGIHDVDSLKGFAVGVERGDACVDRLAGEGIANLSMYANYEAILAASRNGDIRMFCMDDGPANYYLYRYRDQLRFTRAFTLYTGHFHWAVRHGNAAVFALVSQGMARITPAERAALDRKWLKHPIEFWPYLRSILAIVAAACLVLVAALLWVWGLRRTVRRRTAEIREKNELLERQSRALIVEQAQLRTLVESSPDAMWLKDDDGRYIDCNERTAELLGKAREQILGMTDEDLYPDAHAAELVRRDDQQVLQNGETRHRESRVVAPDSADRVLDIIKVPIRAPDGEITGVLGVARDITERRRAERELRIAAVGFESQDGVVITAADGAIERVNSAFVRISGLAGSEIVGKTLEILHSSEHGGIPYPEFWSALTADGSWTGEIVSRRPGGELYTARLSVAAVKDEQGRVIHYVGTCHDLSAEQEARAQARFLELFDPLTRLPNRKLLVDRITLAVEANRAAGVYSAIVMLNLDHFRQINVSLGHDAGDQMLVEISQCLLRTVAKRDIVGRFNGDSFLVMLAGLGGNRTAAVHSASAVADVIRRAVGEVNVPGGGSLAYTCSIGMAVAYDAADTAGMLIRQAELALARSKQQGRNAVTLFEGGMQVELDRRFQMEADLRDAIGRDQFVLYYQLQVDIEGRPIGAEALIRWNHPRFGLVTPELFIPLAEDTGLIEPIGRWVVAEACRQLARWAKQDRLGRLALAINISPRQFKAASFVSDIVGELERNRVLPARLKLEITERLAIDAFESSIDKLRALRTHGLQISLDDFGTGNSSLRYLTKLPLSQLKIDKTFVDDLASSPRARTVVQTIIAMGRGLALDVIAEGVATDMQRAWLAAEGCHAFQGFLFSTPLPLDRFEAMVGIWTPARTA